jgi:hypothetical protein
MKKLTSLLIFVGLAINVRSLQVSRDGETTSQGVIGFDSASGKVVGKTMSKHGNSDNEWTVVDGKLISISKGAWRNEAGEINRFSIARSHHKVDENTMETTVHELTAAGEVGEVALRSDGVKRISKWNRKKL